MTDNEIIKALECWINNFDGDAVDFDILCNAFDLINRQQETIKTLRNCVEQHHIIRKDGKSPLSLLTAEIKAEAIKEFAERLKGQYKGACCFTYTQEQFIEQIDWLVKEMVGDTE